MCLSAMRRYRVQRAYGALAINRVPCSDVLSIIVDPWPSGFLENMPKRTRDSKRWASLGNRGRGLTPL